MKKQLNDFISICLITLGLMTTFFSACYANNKLNVPNDKNRAGELAVKYMLGYEVNENIGKARTLAKKAMDNGDVIGAYCYAFLVSSEKIPNEEHIDPEKIFKQIVDEIRDLSQMRNIIAQDIYGTMLYLGLGIQKDIQTAEKLWLLAAEEGYVPSMNHLGVLYRLEEEPVRNLDNAIYWYGKAAKNGYAAALDDLGYMYYVGIGVKQDLDKAYKLFFEAANKNDAEAQYNLGYMLKEGYDNENRIEDMLFWLMKSSESNYHPATHALAEIYFEGIGVDKNTIKAIEYLKKAASAGFALSENTLGMMYMNGVGVGKDNSRAFDLFSSAASKGNNSAKRNLEKMYELGLVKPNAAR
jgi:TPR repeat protein